MGSYVGGFFIVLLGLRVFNMAIDLLNSILSRSSTYLITLLRRLLVLRVSFIEFII